jgi:hypothetical protein
VFSQLVFVLQVFVPHWFFSNSPQKCKRLSLNQKRLIILLQ